MTTLYNLKSVPDGTFVITKWDDDMNVESSYVTSPSACECPQGHKPTCRHRKMLPIFQAKGAVDKNWFYCYDTHMWSQIWLEGEAPLEGEVPIVDGTLPEGEAPNTGTVSIEQPAVEAYGKDELHALRYQAGEAKLAAPVVSEPLRRRL